jgi:hypothetical protein
VKAGFASSLLLAAGLAGCGATPVEHRNYREIGPGEGLFAETLTWEWRRKDSVPPAAAAPASAAEQEEFKKWRDSASSAERKEFEDWRAWQEWKRKNPK